MAVPSYTTDLTTIATGDLNVDTGTWDESSDAGWDTGGAMVDDQNLYYNNTECVSAQLTKDSNGSGAAGPATIMYVHGSTWTIPTDGAALIHHLWAAPPALNTLAGGGIKVLLGNSLANFEAWNASGSDFAPAPRGGWANYAINPAVGTADDTVGAGASSPYTTVGMAVGALQQARGNPNACNAVRYGRCEAIITGGQAADYATFAGFGAVDNATTARWNLLEPVGTSGFIQQGLMSLGTSGTLVDFRDENKSISIKNTINVTAGFNKIEVVNASSNIEWTAISIAALGTVSKGNFEAIDNATIAKTSCTFTDMGTFDYLSNSTLTTSVYRRCGLVTQGGATFTGCTFDKSAVASSLLVDNMAVVTGNTFNSDGSNYAVDLGTITATTSIDWDNQESGYVAGTAGTDVGVTPTGNETIVVTINSSFVLTINVASGASTPSIATSGTGTVDVVAGSVTTKITTQDINDATLLEANVFLEAADGTGDLPFEDVVTITSVLTTATTTHTAHGLSTGNKVVIRGANEYEYNGAFAITVTTVNAYEYTMGGNPLSPATGTITSTGVIFSDLADATGVSPSTGVVSDSRSFSVDQPVTGRARLSTTAGTLYKTSPITGIIDKASGLSITVQMIPDE